MFYRDLVIGASARRSSKSGPTAAGPPVGALEQIVMNARACWRALPPIRCVIHDATKRSWRITELAHLDEIEPRLSESCGKRRRAIEARPLDDVVAGQNFIGVAQWPGSAVEFAMAWCARLRMAALTLAGRWRDSRGRIGIRPRDPQRKCRPERFPLGSPHVCRHRAR